MTLAGMKKAARLFAVDERGAVTVDWVVLTAALVGLAIAVLSAVAAGSKDVADNIENCLSGDMVYLLSVDGMSYEQRLNTIKSWCSDSIH